MSRNLTKEEENLIKEEELFMQEVYSDPVVMSAEVPTEKMWKNILQQIRINNE